MMKPVKVGVVGLGRFGRLHALTLAGLAEAELVALVGRRQSSLDEIARELPNVRGWSSLEQALAESEAEAWVIASTTASHVPNAKAILSAGKSVLLEKPIADNLADAQSLAPLVKADSSNLMMGHIVLFNSEFQELHEEVRRRGTPIYIDCVRHRSAGNVAALPGESPLHVTMVHDLYATQVLMDRVDPVGFSSQFHRTESGAVDLALAQLQWESGALASFAASFITPPGMAPHGVDRMEVFGKGWAARILPNPRPLEVWDERAHWPMALEIRATPSGATGMMAEELRCFCRVAREIEPVPVGAAYADAMQVQRWMDRLEPRVLVRGAGD